MTPRPRVLVVDDDDDIREIIGILLTDEGFDPDPARDGLEALERVMVGPQPALILLDLMMPGMSGADFVHELRKHPSLAGIPLVVISGDVGGERVAREIGAPFLAKPVELTALLATIDAAFVTSRRAP